MRPVVASTVVEVVFPRLAIFRLRQKSLVRGIVLSLARLLRACCWRDFRILKNCMGRRGRSYHFSPLPGVWPRRGAASRARWSLYHAGVLILLYSDLMILTLIVFLVAYPL